jgi:hypothetical protein
MRPADLRRAVNTSPFRTFRLHLIASDWPIICRYADNWYVSPSGRLFMYGDSDGGVHTIRAEQIARVEYLGEGEDDA